MISLPKAPCADDEETGGGQAVLVPPTDEPQAREAVFIGRVFDGEQVRHASNSKGGRRVWSRRSEDPPLSGRLWWVFAALDATLRGVTSCRR